MKMHGMGWSAFVLFASLTTGAALGQSSPSDNGRLDALIHAAKTEGEVVAYSSQPNPINQRVTQAFTAKYGIKISFLRLSSGPLLQRYASEAAAGNIAADFLFFPVNGSESFLVEAKKQGWLAPITATDIPALASGEYPSKFMRSTPAFPTPVVSIIPWAFGYNTEMIAAKDVPKDWSDLLDPKWKGKIIRTNPQLSLGQMDPWRMLLARYGEAYFDKLREQDPRTSVGEAVAAAQALAAGEGSLLLMTTGAVIQAVKDKGAPVEAVTPAFTTGVEMGIFLSATAKHPNAARLAIQYALSREGSKVQSADPGSVDPYDPLTLPKEYQSPMSDTPSHYDQINKLLSK
jgi:iron(III) transport system substrate-binding protein